jgi:hypothetical protein
LISLLLVPAALTLSGCLRKSKVEAAAAEKEKSPVQKSVPFKFGVSRVLTLPAGTRFAVMVPAKGPGMGSTLEGELAAPISAYTETVVPRGTRVVTEISDPAKGDTQVSVRATQIRLKNGKVVNISSDEPKVVADSAEKLVSFRLTNAVQVTVER